ncbi:MAG: GHKL domain-containing protein [Clostridia bacterium]|nr:GHKL domain-containing protein [Clostridia bacterium]
MFADILDNVLDYCLDFGLVVFVFAVLLCGFLKKRRYFWLRLIGSFAIYNLIVNHKYSIFTFFGLDIFGHWKIWYIGDYLTISYTMIFLLSVLCIWFCYEEKFNVVLFFCSTAYVIQHISSTVGDWIAAYGSLPSDFIFRLVRLFVYSFVFGICYCLISLYRTKKSGNIYPKNLFCVAFAVCAIIVLALISNWVYNASYRNPATYVYTMVCCVLLLVIQFALTDNAVSNVEKAYMEQMFTEKERQMELSKESIDIINMKCHDLKRQVSSLKDIGNTADKKEFIKQIESSIEIYDGVYETGNGTLDTVLTEKSLHWRNYGIRLNCIADGEKLAFLNSIDCYSLFSNLLDNAIEAVCKEAEDKRDISIFVKQSGNFVSVSVENFCTKQLEFSDGLPLTTKGDRINHGFGTRSIRYIVKKYNGNTVMRKENDKFIVSMIIPIP